MARQKRIPVTEYGTLPTPSNPSNQVIQKYPHKTVIYTPFPTEAVFAEYAQAIKYAPGDAGLRVHLACALKKTGNLIAGLEQLQIAVQIKPQWAYAHSMLGHFLKAQGEYDAAIREYQEALRLMLHEDSDSNKGGEVVTRSGLAEALKQIGKPQEAKAELIHAIQIEKELVVRKAGSLELLKHMRK